MQKIKDFTRVLLGYALHLIALCSTGIILIFAFCSIFSFLEMITCGGDCTDTYNGKDLYYSGTQNFLFCMIIVGVASIILWVFLIITDKVTSKIDEAKAVPV